MQIVINLLMKGRYSHGDSNEKLSVNVSFYINHSNKKIKSITSNACITKEN